ncbi:MAG TPA: pyridoxine 5'-phosphate oxidase C-terminal domain-containing protein, partial [Blastocatellia bacterium]|nr:pyridoxine 5'-phosphate oxidase C-terminal domain-containing protein [Blastocatellia bacterium]
SRQSQVIPSREVLEAKMDELFKKHLGEQVPYPSFWGGYRLAPTTIEFWQNRPSRLHDRLRYTKLDDGEWLIERLSP